MNIQQMRYVLEVEKTGSITKAAANLFMGQPNLSKTIKDLENELKISVFHRTPKGVEPTAKGGEFLSYARHIVSQIDELESLYHNSYEKSININISVPRSTYIGEAFSNFLNKTSLAQIQSKDKLQLHYKETNALTAIADVASGESEIGIIRYQEPYEEYFFNQLNDHHLSHLLVKEYTLVIVMSDTHPLAKKSSISFSELSPFIEVVHGDYQVPSLSFSMVKKSSKISPPLKQIFVYDRGSQYDLLQSINGSYMWVSPVPERVLKERRLTIKSCEVPSVINKDVLIFQNDHVFSDFERQFLAQLNVNLA